MRASQSKNRSRIELNSEKGALQHGGSKDDTHKEVCGKKKSQSATRSDMHEDLWENNSARIL